MWKIVCFHRSCEKLSYRRMVTSNFNALSLHLMKILVKFFQVVTGYEDISVNICFQLVHSGHGFLLSRKDFGWNYFNCVKNIVNMSKFCTLKNVGMRISAFNSKNIAIAVKYFSRCSTMWKVWLMLIVELVNTLIFGISLSSIGFF